jgi:hypothetical protein
MFSPVTELKTRARLLLNAVRTDTQYSIARCARISKQQGWQIPDEWTLRHALNIVAGEAGFNHWEHARQAFSATTSAQQDMGTFWYDKQAHGFTNHWFADYPEAKAQLQLHPQSYLLPYKNQFFLAEHACIAQLGLGDSISQWQALSHDLIGGYGSSAWTALCERRLKAIRDATDQTPGEDARTSGSESAEFANRVLSTFVDNGRINKIPQMRKKRLVILQWLVDQLEKERRYPEKEINSFLLQFHEDYATLRREFIACKLMAREDNVYWRC